MPEIRVTRQIQAPLKTVWDVLNDFGDIQRWSPGVKHSKLTSDGPVEKGSTRYCDFASLGSVHERIEAYVPNEQMTISLYEPSKLPISSAMADFQLTSIEDGTMLELNYTYVPNFIGRLLKGKVHKEMNKAMEGLAKALQRECERSNSD